MRGMFFHKSGCVQTQFDLLEKFDAAVQETFPEGVVDMRFSVNQSGTTEDALCQSIEALRQYRAGQTRPYSDY